MKQGFSGFLKTPVTSPVHLTQAPLLDGHFDFLFTLSVSVIPKTAQGLAKLNMSISPPPPPARHIWPCVSALAK